MANKHTEVTAESLLRRAKAHREKAVEHMRGVENLNDAERSRRMSATWANEDAAEILEAEAKELREQR